MSVYCTCKIFEFELYIMKHFLCCIGNIQANKSVERPPQTAESIAERREERRQKLLQKYGYSSPPSSFTAIPVCSFYYYYFSIT